MACGTGSFLVGDMAVLCGDGMGLGRARLRRCVDQLGDLRLVG